MDNIEQVKKIAQQVRRWAVKNRDNYDYSFPHDLGGMCAIAASQLWKRLTEAGIEAKLAIRNHGCESHCFVIVDDYIVDVTATQFGMEPIEIIPKKQARKHWFWKHTKLHDTATELRTYQLKTGWPFEQLARIK